MRYISLIIIRFLGLTPTFAQQLPVRQQQVTDEPYRELERSGQLSVFTSTEWKETDEGNVLLKFDLPRQGVSLILSTW